MSLAKAKILVADDEKDILVTVQAILRAEGYDVDVVSDGLSACNALTERHYDLVLTDLKMPGLDGFSVVAEVAKRSPSTVTVVMTGYSSLDSALETIQMGAYEYLVKPIEVPELKMAVKRALDRKRLSEIDTLYQLNSTVASTLDPNKINEEISDAVQRVLRLSDAFLVSLTSHGLGNQDAQLMRMLSDGELRDRLAAEEIITAANAPWELKIWAEDRGFRSFALIPGCASGNLICVLIAANSLETFEFYGSACRFLSAVANQSALALENTDLLAQLKQQNTALEIANTRLKELDRLKSEFLSIATHELRTPLTIILGYNSMLSESLEGRATPEEKEVLKECATASKRLIRLVNSMLDINQIEAGRMRMNFGLADLGKIVGDISDLFQHEARKKGLTLKAEIPLSLPACVIDSDRIEQVVVNLLGNAIKFTEPGGQIRIALKTPHSKDQVEVSIADTGVGIAEEDQPTIFDEFAQIRRHPEGSGLGLAISKRIVEAHSGHLLVNSMPGKGTTFTFRIPLRPTRGTPNLVAS